MIISDRAKQLACQIDHECVGLYDAGYNTTFASAKAAELIQAALDAATAEAINESALRSIGTQSQLEDDRKRYEQKLKEAGWAANKLQADLAEERKRAEWRELLALAANGDEGKWFEWDKYAGTISFTDCRSDDDEDENYDDWDGEVPAWSATLEAKLRELL